MTKSIYVSGTGFRCGKTLISALISRLLLQNNYKVGYLSVIETGVHGRSSAIELVKWINRGQVANLETNSTYILRKNCSPHLAFEVENIQFDLETIRKKFNFLDAKTDVLVVDGVGGSLTPITRFYTAADLISDFNLTPVLVIPNDVESIHRSAVEVEALFARGIEVAGVFLNNLRIGDPVILEDNKKTIRETLQMDLLGEIPYQRDFQIKGRRISEPFFKPETILAENKIKLIAGKKASP